MPTLFRVVAFCAPCVVFSTQPAMASDVEWRVALSASTASISQPSLPAAHTFRGAGLADTGAGLLGFQWSPNTNLLNPDGNWFESGATFAQYAGVGLIGAQGPGRSGAESTHVFRRLYYGDAFNAAALASAPLGTSCVARRQVFWSWLRLSRRDLDGPLEPARASSRSIYYYLNRCQHLHHKR